MSDKRGFREIAHKIGHIIAGVVILLKAYSKYEEHHTEIAVAIAILGLFFIAIAVFHAKIHWIKRHESWLFWLESLVLFIVSYSYYSAGKFAIPLIYFASAIAYLVVGFIFLKRKQEAH